MAIYFTYTPEDFKEAQAALVQFNAGQSLDADGKALRKPVNFNRRFFGWMVLVVLAAILFSFLRHSADPRPRSGAAVPGPGVSQPTHNFLLTVIPSAIPPILFTAILAWLVALAGKPAGVPFYAPKRATAGFTSKMWRLVAWLSLAACLVTVVCFGNSPTTLNWRPDRLQLIGIVILPWIGWLLLVSTIASISRRRNKNNPGRLGHEESSTRLPQQLEITDQGLITSHAVCRHEFYWNYFVSYLESANLLLLYTKDLTSLVIPKRAFTDLQSIEQFCGLLQARIPAGQFLPRASGFQVLPLPLPPVPAIPVDEG